jgi:hypothetical protein
MPDRALPNARAPNTRMDDADLDASRRRLEAEQKRLSAVLAAEDDPIVEPLKGGVDSAPGSSQNANSDNASRRLSATLSGTPAPSISQTPVPQVSSPAPVASSSSNPPAHVATDDGAGWEKAQRQARAQEVTENDCNSVQKLGDAFPKACLSQLRACKKPTELV